MNPKNIEIEVKFKIENENEVIKKLDSMGARKVAEGLEHNEIFDDGSLRGRGMLLRLRKFGNKSILTFKVGITKREFKEAEEIEIEVNNFEKNKGDPPKVRIRDLLGLREEEEEIRSRRNDRVCRRTPLRDVRGD